MPYRSGGGGTPLTEAEWSNVKRSERQYDALGRVVKVTTRPDGAAFSMGYRGRRVFVTDQAGSQRISKSDALGRLTEVWEVTPNDPSKYPGIDSDSFPGVDGVTAAVFGYRTSYFYDAASNLRRVQQGGQARFFAYDTLGRLIRAKNPEQGEMAADADFPALTDSTSGVSNSQWSAGYKYDGNGNLIKRKDARGVTATYVYDNLNRNTTVDYSDSTPDVSRYYDGATLGKGQLWKSVSLHNALTIIDQYDTGGRPKRQTQQFWVNGATPGWGQAYATTLDYNLAGGVISEIYPSQHSVEYGYDAAGRLGDNGQLPAFKGTLGDGVERTYASQVTYDELGGMSQERFGTDTPVYNKRFYNSRGQLAEIRVSTYSITSVTPTDWNRGAIINHYSLTAGTWGATGGGPDNNGNLRKQEVYIPAGGQIPSLNAIQAYSYDALNRLTSVEEKLADASPSFSQSYSYDRFGNRTITTAGTSNAPSTQFDARDLSATNRIYAPGDLDYPDPADSRRRMRYDAAGNLTYDSYTGAGARVYDAENRMTSAQTNVSQNAVYTYDADGRRVKRNAGGGEVWQVYGAGGKLLAEYAAGDSPNSPQKEYGYRSGELLITADAPSAGWGSAPVIHDNPLVARQTIVQSRHITELRAAIDALRAHKGLAAYSWQAAASVGDLITADPISEMRQALDEALGAPSGGYAPGLAQHQSIMAVHIQELRDRVLGAWQAGGSGSDVRWLVTDQLGTPRMILEKTGSLAGVARHDYFPFGGEVGSDANVRTTARGYGAGDVVRQKFTSKERDAETGLDYFGARYFSSSMGRWTSTDWSKEPEPTPYADLTNPQSLNLYAYVYNNPLRAADPDGHSPDWWQKLINGLSGSGWKTDAEIEAARIEQERKVRQEAARDAQELEQMGFDPGEISRLSNQQVIDFYNAIKKGETGVSSGGQRIEIILAGPVTATPPTVSNPKLQNIVNDLYKGTKNPNPVGNGTTTDAIRNELRTNQPTGGTFHFDKGRQYIRALNNWLKNNPGASAADRQAAVSLRDDLANALAGK
jgi:RHS repeat-associated protein